MNINYDFTPSKLFLDLELQLVQEFVEFQLATLKSEGFKLETPWCFGQRVA